MKLGQMIKSAGDASFLAGGELNSEGVTRSQSACFLTRRSTCQNNELAQRQDPEPMRARTR